PEQLDAFEAHRARLAGEPAPVPHASTAPARTPRGYVLGGLIWLLVGGAAFYGVWAFGVEKELYILSGFVAAFGVLQILVGGFHAAKNVNGVTEVVDDIFRMPRTMRDLAVVQFFSWFALFSMWIYTTAAVTSVHYGATDTTSAAYNAGADWVGVLFGVYNGVAALAAFAIPVLARRTGRKGAHAINLVLGALGFLGIFLIRDPQLLWLPMIGVGFAWASILSMPYAILSGALPARKMGVYMGVFNIFIVVPQLVAATILGLVLKSFFDGQAIFALVIGAGAFGIAALMALRVRES
ncbi:MAG: MFS transporter, partial [Brevundimonas sp.]